MRCTWIALVIALALGPGCGPSAEPPPRVGAVLPRLTADDTDPSQGYERPPAARASDLLPPEIVSGPHHHVRETVQSDGFMRIYALDSDFGRFETAGEIELLQRVQEIRAIAALHDLEQADVYARAGATAAREPWVERWNLVDEPVETHEGVPAEAWQEVLRVTSLPPDARTTDESELRRGFLDFERAKRRLALHLGINVYSGNPRLQRELNRAAWMLSAGGFPLSQVPSLAESSVAPLPADVLPEERLEMIFANDSPEDLRRRNRIELAVMGIELDEVDAFLAHPAYSPLRQTGMVEALLSLDGAANRDVFLRTAMRAETPHDAVFYLVNALVLRWLHLRVSPVERIVLVNERTPAGYTRDGSLLVGAMVDHVAWTRPVENFVHALATKEIPGVEIESRELWLTGSLTPKARDEIRALDIVVVEDVFAQMFERLFLQYGALEKPAD